MVPLPRPGSICFNPPLAFLPVAARAVVTPEPLLSVDGGVELLEITNGSGEAVELELNPPPPQPSLDGLGWNV